MEHIDSYAMDEEARQKILNLLEKTQGYEVKKKQPPPKKKGGKKASVENNIQNVEA